MRSVCRNVRTWFAILTLAAIVTARAQGTFEAVISYSNSVAGFIDGTAGWTFQPLTTIDVTSLGCFDYVITSQGTISVGLWSSDGTLLASNSVTPTSTLVNLTRYESITPIALDPGHTYHLGAYSAFGSIGLQAVSPATDPPGVVQLSPEIQLGGYANAVGGFVFPAAVPGGAGALYLGPNFQFAGRVPEPSSSLLLGFGALAFPLMSRAARARKRSSRSLQ